MCHRNDGGQRIQNLTQGEYEMTKLSILLKKLPKREKAKNGADDGIRTHDINLGKVALYP